MVFHNPRNSEPRQAFLAGCAIIIGYETFFAG